MVGITWAWLLTGVAVVFIVARWTRSRRGKYSGGRSGPAFVAIPRSSEALQTELKRAADEQMAPSEQAEMEIILKSVSAQHYEEALREINLMLGATHLHADVRTLLLWIESNVYQRTRNAAEEIRVLVPLCESHPHCMFELNLANAYSELEKYEYAETRYLRAISLSNGNYPLAHYNLGILYCRMGRELLATVQLQTLEKSGESVPKNLIERLRLRISELERKPRKR